MCPLYGSESNLQLSEVSAGTLTIQLIQLASCWICDFPLITRTHLGAKHMDFDPIESLDNQTKDETTLEEDGEAAQAEKVWGWQAPCE